MNLYCITNRVPPFRLKAKWFTFFFFKTKTPLFLPEKRRHPKKFPPNNAAQSDHGFTCSKTWSNGSKHYPGFRTTSASFPSARSYCWRYRHFPPKRSKLQNYRYKPDSPADNTAKCRQKSRCTEPHKRPPRSAGGNKWRYLYMLTTEDIKSKYIFSWYSQVLL